MAEFTQIFGAFIWKAQVEENQEILDKCLNKIETYSNEKPVIIPSDWECSIHSSYKSDDPNMKLDSEWLNPIYAKYINSFLEEFLDKPAEFKIFDPWYNVFSINQFQEAHTHFPHDFSLVHYVSFDESEHLATTFVNPNSIAAEAQFSFRKPLINKINKKDPKKSFYMTNYTPLDVQQGDLIIFPSSLSHFVKYNTSSKKRITFTLNFEIV
jgi:uncharacterized protein (TIGR02466 family)